MHSAAALATSNPGSSSAAADARLAAPPASQSVRLLSQLQSRHRDGPEAVSRRISPVMPALEDGSSATSNDSGAHGTWSLAERQLLFEEQPVRVVMVVRTHVTRFVGEGAHCLGADSKDHMVRLLCAGVAEC